VYFSWRSFAVSEISDEKTETLVGNIVVYRTVNWPEEIAAIAGPFRQNETREGWLSRAARKSQSTFWHTKALFYSELKDPKFSVAIKILNAADKARKEAAILASRFETLAGNLNAENAHLHSSDVLTLIDAARALRGMDRA
jgi:hypothetical protein